MPNSFDALFRVATGKPEPYAYQCRLACGPSADPSRPETLRSGNNCRSQLINIPTGLGKTAAVVLAWLWNRLLQPEEKARVNWPRRLVYCLPMRTLVEQTEREVRAWLGNLLWDDKGPHEDKVGVHILMGGEDAGEWDIHPEREAILIGTQDMLLSRALNRGYGMNRYRWPMHFGLLNNDALWVMDETQLMGVGVETSAQLDAFRAAWPVFGKCPTWWMSATLEDARLATVDAPAGERPRLELSAEEKEAPGSRPRELFEAKKSVAQSALTLSPSLKGADYAKQLAAFIKERHQPGTLTLVVVNRVSRAREIFEALTTLGKKKQPALCEPDRVALIHSRFRPVDRERHTKLLFGEGDRIVIATQAIEAGVDVSARLLITELAPWSSLVQRMGRCNRRAEFSHAEVQWVDIEPDTKGDLLLPYSKDELTKARDQLKKLTDASPRSLGNVDKKDVEEAPIIRPVIRRRDLVDLFDTTPDICGQDLDISRYIRDGDDNDVQFFWRIVDDDGPTPDEKPPRRDELCRVSFKEGKDFLKAKTTRAWRWNPLDEKWEPASSARPGAVYLIDVKSGGYSEALGWTGEPGDRPEPLPAASNENERHGGDPRTFTREWQTLTKHTEQVVAKIKGLATSLALPADEAAAFAIAAQWHDIGKAHPHFQQALRDGPHQPDEPDAIYAKSKNPPARRTPDTPYRSIRHELASALAWLLAAPPDAPERDLVAYLIAAHHGKVRLSIRSLPNEPAPDLPPMPDGNERLFARGIWHQHKDDAEKHDVLPPLQLADLATPEIPLDLTFMHMGTGPHGPSWLARAIVLRDRLGPFRLAFFETLLRAADARASSLAK